jgi:endoglucanase
MRKHDMTRYTLAALALLATPAAAQTRFGVNLSGCTFVENGSLCPTVDDVAWYIDKAGFRSIRLPFHGSQASNPVIIQRIHDIVKAANARNVPVILDRHDYQWPTPAAQIAFWIPILRRMNDPEMVMVDLMNEPKRFNDPVMTNDWLQWVRDTNLIIAGIRKAGIRNRILVEWPQYSASFRFDKKEPASKECQSAACAIDRTPGGLADPLKRVILSPHRYFNTGASGTTAPCVSKGDGQLGEFAVAARKRGFKAILGEYAFGNYKGAPASCAAISVAVMASLKADADVWIDAMAWGGGRAWPDSYIFKIEPAKGARAKAPLPDLVKVMAGR